MLLEEVLRHHGFDLSSLSLAQYQRVGDDHLIYLLRVPATESLTQWEFLRNLVPETRYWPVIGWDRFKEPPWKEASVQDIIEAGLNLDIQQWFDQERREIIRSVDNKSRLDADAVPPFVFTLSLARFTNTLPPLVPIALLPTTDFWEVPAFLSLTLNEWDPPPEVHVAIMKYWNERWKVELVGAVPGLIEMRVLQPPRKFEEALALATEQYIYCPDLVDQDLKSRNILAKKLLNSPIWRFWWD